MLVMMVKTQLLNGGVKTGFAGRDSFILTLETLITSKMKMVMKMSEPRKRGRPRKYDPDMANAIRCAVYRDNKRKKGFSQVVCDLDEDGVIALNSLKRTARAPNRNGKIISKALVFYAKFKLRVK